MSDAHRTPAPSRALLDAAAAAAKAPARPVLPTGLRTAAVVVAGMASLLVLGATHGWRDDMSVLGMALSLAPAVLRFAAGALLVAFALRESVPGRAAPPLARVAAFAMTPVLIVVLAEWVESGAHAAGGHEAAIAAYGLRPAGCYPTSLAVALPAAVVFGWLFARAYPLRPMPAAALGLLGAGLLADAAMHLTCPATSALHTIVVHGGGVLTMAVAGTAIGWWREARRRRRVR